MRTCRRIATTLALAFAAALVIVTPAQAGQVPSGWTWTNYGPDLSSVSCASAGACVAVGQAGAVLHMPNTPDIPLVWTMLKLTGDPDPVFAGEPVDLVGVFCDEDVCLALSNAAKPRVDFPSRVYRSTDGGVSWTEGPPLPPVGRIKTTSGSAVACTPYASADVDHSDGTCFVVGTDGGVWRSTDLGQTWRGVPLPATAPATSSFDKVACPTADTCVAAGGDTRPTSAILAGDAITPLDTPVGIDKRWAGLSCDVPGRCVGTGGIAGYSQLSLAQRAWGKVRDFRDKAPKGLVVKALSCPIADACIGLTGDGIALRTSELDGTSDWARRPTAPTLLAVDCAQTACVAVGKAASWYASFDLGLNWGRVNEVAKFDVAECATELSPTCLAGGKENVGVSRTGGTLWTLPLADRGALNTKAIECTAPSSCLVLGMTDALSTTDLDVFRPLFGPNQTPAGSDNQSCVTATICVGVSDGAVYTTLDGGRTPWSQNAFPHVRPMAGVACIRGRTDPVTCIVPIKDQILLGTMTLDAGGLPHWSWRWTNADLGQNVNAAGCDPSGAQCTAVGPQGMVATTTGDGLLDWDEQAIPPNVPIADRPVLTSVTCPAAGFCIAGGTHGPQAVIASTTNDWADFAYDELDDLRGSIAVNGFGCESVDRCVAVGDTVLVGVRTPAAG
jgi:hypothetical protein